MKTAVKEGFGCEIISLKKVCVAFLNCQMQKSYG
jgi:hypothetical protein